MEQKDGEKRQKLGIARFRWVIGTPYFVQGTSTLTEIPILYFIKFTLQMGDSGGQLFDALRQSGWFVKPLWGIISDKIPVFGYHRKSWYILMAFAAIVFWLLNALLSYVGIAIPLVYLVTFNLAFATYAFVDVVCDALMVTYGRRAGRVGSFINFQWAVLALANAGSVYLGGERCKLTLVKDPMAIKLEKLLITSSLKIDLRVKNIGGRELISSYPDRRTDAAA